MARKARDAEVYGLYHIYQRGGSSRQLFESKADREKFLEILSQARIKFGFKLYGYCIRQTNQYHLILYTNGSDLSKIMKSINIAYAMYVKAEGKLYKDRYKSELIESAESLKALLKFLHQDSESSEFNSYCAYENQINPELLIDIEPRSVLSGESVSFEDAQPVCEREIPCTNCMETAEEAQEKLREIATEHGMNVPELLKDKPLRNEMIVHFRKNSLLSLKELGSLFGGLSESTVCKILSSECECMKK